MKPDPAQVLADGARELLGLELAGEALAAFSVYLRELLTWNRTTNLTGITDPLEVAVKHFLDSLTPVNLITRAGRDNPTLIDVGAGAGFPGIPLRIAHPGIRLTLVESKRRKVSFMSYLLGLLEIDARLVHGRAEDIGETFDFVVSRAFREPGEFISIALNLTAAGGRVVMMLGRRGLDPGLLDSFGLIKEAEEHFELPFDMGKRRVALLRRI